MKSLPVRVAGLAAAAVGLVAAGVAVSAFLTVEHQMQSSLDASLLERAHRAAEGPALAALTSREVPSWALGAADVQIAFVAPGVEPVSADRGPTLSLGTPELHVALREDAYSLRTITAEDGVRYRVAAVPAGDRWALVIAQSLGPMDHALGRLATVLLVSGGVGMLLAALVGLGVARTGLRPVRRLTRAVEQVANSGEMVPIPVDGDDEIARLARSFNATLAALAESRDRQRQLVADASHELRTPLTSLRTNIELLLQADSHGGLSSHVREELLQDVQAQMDEFTTLVADITELARDDQPAATLEHLDLADVVDRSVARVRRRAPGQHIEVSAESWWVRGERVALDRAVTNLLDNAVKWNRIDGVVSVRLHDGTLAVTDQGPGIAEEDLPHVFERFYRSTEARNMPGSGLGLSIVEQVATRHSGSVAAYRAEGGGARVQMWLPGSAKRP